MSLRDMTADLFRSPNKSDLARALGISRPTLDRYQKNPDAVPLCILRRAASIKGYKVKLIPSDNDYTL